MKVLVTGGAGFIGGHLVDALLAEGATVRVIDNFSTGRRENIAHNLGRIELHEADLCDPDAAARAVAGVELIFHEAAIPSVSRSVADPVASNRVNVGGTVQLLEAARRAGTVRKVVYAASSSAYGDTEVLPKVETMPAMPLSPYAVSKHTGEQYMAVFGRLFGFETLSLRYFNVFGPRQDPRSVYAAAVPIFIERARSGRAITVFGDGAQTRDFVYVEDVAAANILAATHPDAGRGEVFNVAQGGVTTIADLARTIVALTGSSSPIEFAPERPGDIRHSRADISRIRAQLGFDPKTSLAEGLRLSLAEG